MKPRPQAVFRFTAPLRAAMQRFTFALLLLMSTALMLVSKADLLIIERARALVGDLLAPVLELVAEPVARMSEAVGGVTEFLDVRRQNAQLREDLARIERWQEIARKLESENQSLRQLLNFAPEAGVRSVTGRVVADSGGAFVRSMLVGAGGDRGVAKGHVAMSGEGLVGRVTEVGLRSARVLLITDLNSRIPVVLEGTRERAVLAGDNSGYPRLLYLAVDTKAQPGERVVTSGHGGTLPAGLPIGIVATLDERGPRVLPYVDWNRLEFVRLVDYGAIGAEPKVSAPGSDAPRARPR